MNTRAVALVAALILLPLTGCQGARAIVNGKVIPGAISFIGVVDSTDERLNGEGIAGATISVRSLVENQPTVDIGQATSDPKGNFRLSIKDQKALSRAAELSARKDGYLPANGRMPLPPASRRLLVILKSDGTPPRPQ